MNNAIRSYLAEIGRKGGRKSRRKLDPETARDMVRVREARRAFRKFHALCFWSYRKDLEIGLSRIDWVVETLRKNGDMRAWKAAERLCGTSAEADDRETTRIDWAHDSAWRFMPLVRLDEGGLVLHDVDLAINKVLTLAGRDEPRDFVDILHAHEHILPLGALIWAAVAKDPGFNPASLLEQLKRRGCYRSEEFDELVLAAPLDLAELKAAWRAALAAAAEFIRERPYEEAGCLYYSPCHDCFVAPSSETSLREQGLGPPLRTIRGNPAAGGHLTPMKRFAISALAALSLSRTARARESRATFPDPPALQRPSGRPRGLKTWTRTVALAAVLALPACGQDGDVGVTPDINEEAVAKVQEAVEEWRYHRSMSVKPGFEHLYEHAAWHRGVDPDLDEERIRRFAKGIYAPSSWQDVHPDTIQKYDIGVELAPTYNPISLNDAEIELLVARMRAKKAADPSYGAWHPVPKDPGS